MNKSSFFAKTLILFALTQALGIYVAVRILPHIGLPAGRDLTDFSAVDLLVLAVFIILFLFVSSRFPRFGSVLYKVFLTIVAFTMMQLVFAIWLGPVNSTLAAVAILILFWSWQRVFLQNALMILTLAGLGAILGLALTPISAVIILVVLSFYDIVAVYITGHMIRLAEATLKSGAIFGFIIPSTTAGFAGNMKNITPGEQFMILGSGDVALPLVLTASLVRVSLVQAIVVAVFSLLGLILTHLIFTNQATRRPMAALPPIAAASIIGYLAASFL